MSRLLADRVTLAYGRGPAVVESLSVSVPDGVVTSIIGPNGCGKSTLLRALARLIAPASGTVILDGEAIHRLPTKEVARRLGLLPQHPSAPDVIAVEDLVRRGRYPHRSLLQPMSAQDHAAVERALELAGVAHLRERAVDELSGGQRQRVWIAMALAQETPILLLDEPTTFLDIAHQIEVLDLVADLNDRRGATVVMVLHDLNHACRYADHVIAMSGGAIVASGAPAEVITAEVVREVFGLECIVVDDPVAGTPMVVPAARAHRRSAALVA